VTIWKIDEKEFKRFMEYIRENILSLESIEFNETEKTIEAKIYHWEDFEPSKVFILVRSVREDNLIKSKGGVRGAS